MRIDEVVTKAFANKVFKARVRLDQGSYKQLIFTTVVAKNLQMAKRLLTAQYGKGNVIGNPQVIQTLTEDEVQEGLTWRGYPCTKDCSGHAAGDNWAEEHGIENPEDCPTGSSNSFWEGCKGSAENKKKKEPVAEAKKDDKRQSDSSLSDETMDPKTREMIKVARAKYPGAKSELGAILKLMYDIRRHSAEEDTDHNERLADIEQRVTNLEQNSSSQSQ
jgi:hypothetical protein